MADCPGVRSVEINHLTGSVLMLHNAGPETIVEYAGFCDFFRYSGSNIHQRVSEGFSDLDKNVRKITGGDLDLGTAVFLALAGAGIYQIARGNLGTPAWYTAFWYAFGVFLKAK